MRDTEYFWGMGYVTLILFAIIAVLFILVVVTAIIVEAIKRYKKMWDEISQMFLIGSLSEITVFGDVSREYLVDKPDKSDILNI